MNRNYFTYNVLIFIFTSFLFSSYSKIDDLQENSNFKEALELFKELHDPNDVEILWRL